MGNASTTSRIDRIAARFEPPFPLRLLGVGLTYAWSSCLWEIPLAVGDAPALALQGTLLWLVSAVLTPVACLVLALMLRGRELSASNSMYVAGPLLAVAGTLAALWYPYASGAAAAFALAVGGVGTGIGPVVLILLWSCELARIEPDVAETAIPASFVTTLLCVLVVPSLSGVAAAVVVALLPVASGVLLLLTKRSVDQRVVARFDPTETPHDARVRTANVVRAFVLIAVAYGIGCTAPFLFSAALPPAMESATTAVGMLVAVAFSALLVVFSTRVDLGAVYRWISVPLVFSLICTAFDSWAADALSYCLGSVVFTGLEIITVLYFVRLSQKTNRTVTFLVGIGVCATYTGVLIGYLAGPFLHGLVMQGVTDAKTCALVLIGVFVVSTLLAPHRDGAWVERTAPVPELPHESEATPVAIDPLEARCAALASAHGLSRREREVFALLARGRSRPYIRDTLVLSKNTVATHVKHIYQKLDVHSQQELLDLVQGDEL
ncbi:helix-turn-helix transcriptional regulator [Eggerthella sinensis]|uniref:helix-turn-helix transcriptional regulator n=1 Tax=Eggerthella sinensis TaxID=242230 RepID=UPI00248E0999|nr:helix-turn-helix transcriptional regulator [Eggerthella sinensis]